jgi:hypothetical protein
MKRIKLNLVLAALILTGSIPVFGQHSMDAFSGLSVGLKFSPFMGYGLELATPLSNHFILRGGLTLTGGVETPDVNVALPDDDNTLYDAFGYVPVYRARAGMNFTHGNVLVDIHPAGIFHLTAGVFFGSSHITLNGFLADSRNNNIPSVLKDDKHEWPTVNFGDQNLVLEGGRANLDLRLGDSAVKPYIGMGVGRAIAKNSRVAFKFEIGAMYNGGYSLKHDGKILDLENSTNQDVKDVHDIMKLISWWPTMNFQLSYRIF